LAPQNNFRGRLRDVSEGGGRKGEGKNPPLGGKKDEVNGSLRSEGRRREKERNIFGIRSSRSLLVGGKKKEKKGGGEEYRRSSVSWPREGAGGKGGRKISLAFFPLSLSARGNEEKKRSRKPRYPTYQ